MKTLKYLMAGALALAFAGTASAQTTIKFTGSTAYRGATLNALKNVLLATGNTLTGYGYAGTSYTGATYAILEGTVAGTSVIVLTDFTGSEAGIQTVAGTPSTNLAIPFLLSSNLTVGGNSVTLTTGGVSGLDTASGNLINLVPDVAMSDTWQVASQFASGKTSGKGAAQITYGTLNEIFATGTTALGVVPFKWVTSGSIALTNITDDQIRALYGAGYIQTPVITGNAAQHGTFVFALGRNPDSGTRLTAFGNAGLGTTATVYQFNPLTSASAIISNTNQTMATLQLTAAGTVNTITVPIGNNGASSGGTLAEQVSAPWPSGVAVTGTSSAASFSGTAGAVVAYCSCSDIDKYIVAGGTTYGLNGVSELSYNGVTLGGGNAANTSLGATSFNYNNATALTQGQYKFWAYEHMYTAQSVSAPIVTTYAQLVAQNIHDVTATVFVTSMQAKRTSDAGAIAATYLY